MSPESVEEIKKIKNDHRFLSENLIDTIWIVDVETLRFDYIKESNSNLSGYPADELEGLSFEDRMTPESFREVEKILRYEVLKFEKGLKSIRTIEVELIRKTGLPYWCEIKARLLKEQDGRLKIIGVTKDITMKKRVEQEKNELLKQLGLALAENEKLQEENLQLKKLLSICSACKRIRDDEGKWWPIDIYIQRHSETQMSHTICPDCSHAFYGNEDWYNKLQTK